ncbi:hypothetical protein [Candidatus Halobonum tyrrellensis]|uniref:DUF8163 domain-containing protein n=1 Tax=Candidatus Halobonum tyrrellensis G22 TaxID=1324957 RepID=V4HJS8_9EURY|nr:hypothetical protein [Candidatus Halobonum tyrrellensis]ESP90018.1 hypothetical protein K933_00607 [Candidatus Halobonum tyrrellensis G22]
MSERAESAGDIDADGDGRYSPFDRLERRSDRVPELVSVLVAVGGLFLQGGRVGVAAGVLLVALWLFLRVEFVFAAGAVLVAGVGGDPTSLGGVLVVAGLAGLLAVDLWRTWASARPVALFAALFTLVGAGIVAARERVVLHWLGLGVVAAVALASYLLHRYEVFRLDASSGTGPESGPPEHDDGSDRRSEVP